jgi:sugar phosphate isomerase/epimerase
MNNNCL